MLGVWWGAGGGTLRTSSVGAAKTRSGCMSCCRPVELCTDGLVVGCPWMDWLWGARVATNPSLLGSVIVHRWILRQGGPDVGWRDHSVLGRKEDTGEGWTVPVML